MPIKTKDHDKCKEWERRRRDRLNDAFKNLAQLLPQYDPAKIPAKIDILEKSMEFVKELRLSNSRLLSKQAENDEKCKLIKELQDEVNKLILRVKQLTILLKKAKISIPTGPAIKALGSKRLKWSDKIKPPDDAENSNVIPKPNPVVLSPVKDADSVAKDTSNNPSTNPLIPPVTTASSEVTISNTPSIIIPLKEPNSTKPNDKPKPVEPPHASPPITTTSSSVSSSPASKTFTTTVVSATLPTPTLLSEPIFTTSATPLQLPLQTIFLTPCSLTGQTSQLLTRITLPAPILPRLDGHSLQKIPIRQVLKPIPKVIKRRRKRTKKIVTDITQKSNTSANSITPATSKEIVTKKMPEKEPDVVIAKANMDASVDDKVESIAADVQSTATHASPSKESSDNENVHKVAEKEKAPSKPERNVEEVDSVQDKIAEKIKADDAEIVITSSSLLETDKPNPEAGATREVVAESDSIPVLRIIDDASQVNENSSIFSCVIVEDEHAENEKTSNESLSTVSIAEELPSIVTEEMQQETHAPVEVAVPMPAPVPSRPEKVTDAIISAENEPDKELLSNQLGETSEKNACMEEKETSGVDEAMETDIIVLSKSTNADKLDSTGADLLLPKTLDKLNLNPVVIETSHKLPFLEPVVALIPETPTNLQVDVRVTLTKDSTLKLNANTITEPVTAAQSKELEQPTVVSIPIVPILANDALPSTSSLIKSTDYAISTPVKEISPSLDTIRQLEPDTSDNVTTTDKISECIARSIDLIDANDSELMELGEHWETGGSPKSPISPTQMFLNIFPLLPRENSMNEQQQQQHQPPTQTTPQKSSIPFPSSSSRSSFFIDAMLPDDHSVNNSATINEDMEMISSSTSQSQCLALTPPQFSSSISHSIASSLSTPNTSYYWNTASCSTESTMDYRGSHVPARNVINSAPTPIVITSTATSATSTKSTSNATMFYSSVSTPVTTTPSTSVNSKITASESPRKSSKSGGSSKQSSTGLPSYASRSKSSATSSTSSSTSVTWAVTTTPSHSFNVSNSQPLSTPAVQSLTQLHSTSSVSASGSQPHSHSCSLLDALNPMDASFFRPLINALDSHDFRALEFPPTTPLPPPPPPLPSLIPPTKPLYTPQFSSHNQQGVQNQMSVNYHQPITHDQNTASIPSSIIHHHHHHHPSLFSNVGVGNTEHSAATIQDLGLSRKQHQVQHSSTHQTHQPISQIAPPTQQPTRHETLATAKSNQNPEKPEKPSRASSKQGKSESSRQSRSGKSSRTQPYIVPSSTSSCSQATASANNQRQQQVAFVPQPQISHTPYHTHTNHANQSSNSALKLSSASSSKNQQLYTPHTPSVSTNLGISAQQQQQQSQHYNSHAQQQQSLRQASTVKVSETKPQKTKHDERSQTTQNQSKSRIYQNLPQQATASQPPSSIQNVVPTSTQGQTVVGNSATSGIAQAHQSHHIAHKSQQHHQSSNTSHAFQFHPSDSFQLFPDFSSNMSRQFNAHAHPSESSTNFNLQPSTSQSNATTTSNFPIPSQRSHHPYYLPDISSTSFDNFTMPIPPAAQQIHSNTPGRQPAAGGSSCNQSSKYMYGSSTTNVSQQIAASSANRMPQSQPVQAPGTSTLFQQPVQRHHHAHQEISYSHTPQHQPNSHTQPIQAIPHSQAQTVPPPVRVSQRQTQGHESCQQTQPRNQPHQSTTSSSKTKQTPVQSLPAVNYPPPNIQQPQNHHLHQHQQQHVPNQTQQPQQQQHIPNQTQQPQQQQHVSNQSQQPQQQQQSNRPSASRTVNWMTDTGYRTTSSSTNTNTGSNKQCVQQSGPTNNPFSVSKLVGIPPTAPAKPQQSSNIDATSRNQQPQQPSSTSSNVARNKSSSSTNPGTSTGNNSNTQSSYCAEALIRKNPEWENFNASTNSNFPNYASHSTSSASHNTDHFPNYSNLGGPSYQYSTTSSSGQHSASTHFSHFGGTQPQHFHTSHHQQQHQPQTSNFHASQHQPQSHTIHPHTQQPSQIHYQHHHQHHPHQSHGTSTSSVSNFNLSTIFPEINDKRNSSNNAGAGQVGGGSGSNVGRSTGTSGNMTTFNYHHPAFPGNTGNSHQ